MPRAPAGLFVVCLSGWGRRGGRFTHSALPGTSLSRRRENSLCSRTVAAFSGDVAPRICEPKTARADGTEQLVSDVGQGSEQGAGVEHNDAA